MEQNEITKASTTHNWNKLDSELIGVLQAGNFIVKNGDIMQWWQRAKLIILCIKRALRL